MEMYKSKNQIKKEMKKQKIEKFKENRRIKRKEKSKKKLKLHMVRNKTEYSIGIYVFNENNMLEKEYKSLSHQIGYIYGFNKNNYNPVDFYLINLEYISQYLPCEYKKWKYLSKINKEAIFLSPDAEEPLFQLEKDKIYLIGGIVDRNRCKKYVLNYSNQVNLPCKRLPIKEYVNLNCCHTLNIPTVFEILHTFIIYKDWEIAFKKCIPKRKIDQVL